MRAPGMLCTPARARKSNMCAYIHTHAQARTRIHLCMCTYKNLYMKPFLKIVKNISEKTTVCEDKKLVSGKRWVLPYTGCNKTCVSVTDTRKVQRAFQVPIGRMRVVISVSFCAFQCTSYNYIITHFL